MQKRRLILVLVGLITLFSLFQLYSLAHNHSSSIQKATLIRFKYLMGVHVIFLLSLLGMLIFEDFCQSSIVLLVLCLSVTATMFTCQEHIKKIPGHKQDDDYLIFRENRFKRQTDKTFLSMYYLIYLYSIMGSILLGIFLLARYLVICYYQRQLFRRLQTVVSSKNYSEQLKGKECSICISQFMECMDDDLYQLNTCQHVFHANCIKEWVNYSKTCPLCRANIFPNRRSNQHLYA